MPREVEFFYDLSSPYSYLAATQIDRVAAAAGASVRYRPFVLGAVFKATGNVMPASCPPKGRYMFQDLGRWAQRYEIPFHFSSHFPFNAIKAERLILAAARDEAAAGARLTHALYRAAWGDEDADISDGPTLVAIASAIGLDGARLLAASEEPAIKDQLRANTDDAIRRGAFGAPSCFVGESLFVGNDRLDFVAAALAALAP